MKIQILFNNLCLIFVLLLVNPLLVHAELRSAKALTYMSANQVFHATLEEGFHFNEKAPNSIVSGQKKILPKSLRPRELSFETKGLSDGNVYLYVCDDKLTFCESHKIALSQKEALGKTLSKKNENVRKDEHGFNQGSFAQALRNTKGLMLLDFTAKWCPGCVRFNTEVFGKSEFKSLTKDIYKLKVDVDLFENSEISENYKISGIPTLIITDKMGHEIHRMVGFDTMAKVKEFILDAKNNPVTLHQFADNYIFKDEAEKTLAGIRFFDAEEYTQARDLMQDLHLPPYQYLAAKVQAARQSAEKNPKSKPVYIQNLKEAIIVEPKSSRSLGWRIELVKQLEGNAKEIEAVKNEGVKIIDELLSDEKLLKESLKTDSVGEFVGYDKWTILMYKADLLDAAGAPDADQEKVYTEAAKVGMEAHIPIKLQGPNLRLLVMLVGAKNWAEAEKHVNQMLKEDSKNTDLLRRKVKILLSLEKFKEAKEISEDIINKVEGRNEFLVAESLAKAYTGLKDSASAKKVIMAYLGKPEMQTDKMKSLKKSFEKILADQEK